MRFTYARNARGCPCVCDGERARQPRAGQRGPRRTGSLPAAATFARQTRGGTTPGGEAPVPPIRGADTGEPTMTPTGGGLSGLQRFEHRLSGLVEGSFAKLFRGRVEPVELAAALAREADLNKAVGPKQVLVPNVYDIDLGPSDFARLAPYALTLADELAAMTREHAAEQGYTFLGPVSVTLRESASMSTGSYRVESRVEAGYAEPSTSPSTFTPPPPVAAPPPASLPITAPPIPSVTANPTTVLPKPKPERPVVFAHLALPDGTSVTIGSDTLVIGRGQDADVRITDSSVSRRHARVSVAGTTIVIEDLGSTNGTSVNNRRITREELRIGDTVNIGAAVLHVRG